MSSNSLLRKLRLERLDETFCGRARGVRDHVQLDDGHRPEGIGRRPGAVQEGVTERRPGAGQRYLHGALVARSFDGEGDLVSGLLGVDRHAPVVAAVDRLAVDRGDRVSGLEAGIVGRSPVDDFLQARGTVVGEADAEIGVVDASVLDQLRARRAGRCPGTA